MADVGCAGILVADTFCGPMRHLPREGELLALDAMYSSAGGCAANTAINLTKQGISVDAVGCLGNDPSAQIILSTLQASGVGCDYVTMTNDYPTSQTVILLVEGQDRRYIHVFGANKAFSTKHIDRDWLARLKVFYLGGLFILPGIDMADLRDVLSFCKTQNIVTVVDVVVPAGQGGFGGLDELLPYIDYFVPNEDEAREITGMTDPIKQFRAFQDVGAGTVIITRADSGLVAARGREVWRAGVFPTKIVDPSGSGDAFSAGLITGIVHGWELPDSLVYASALGASAIRAIGTTHGVFTAQEAQAFLAQNTLRVTHETLV